MCVCQIEPRGVYHALFAKWHDDKVAGTRYETLLSDGSLLLESFQKHTESSKGRFHKPVCGPHAN